MLQQEVDRQKGEMTELRKQQEAARGDIEVAKIIMQKAENKNNDIVI